MTALEAVAYYLPANRVPIASLTEKLGLRDRDIQLFQRFYGLSEVCREPESTLTDLLIAAVGKLTELAGAEERVTYVLYARGNGATVPYPLNPVHDVCAEFGLTNAAAFTVTNHACANGLLAIDLAGRMLLDDGDPDALALVITGEKTFTRDAELVPETSIFSEGAAACLVSAHGRSDRLLAYASSMRGEFDTWRTDRVEAFTRYSQNYPDCLAEVLQAVVDQAGLELADIALILPHNVNTVSWKRLCKRIGYPAANVVLDNVASSGHSFASDPFINYRTAVDQGRLNPGDKYLMAAAGLGAVFSAMIFEH